MGNRSNSDGAAAATAGEFIVSRTFDAPRERVFAAWTECAHLMRWWGPKGCTVLSCRNDLRPGGTFHYGMRMPNNGPTLWGKWVHREIVRPERLVFLASFADEAGNTVRNPWSAEWPLETLSIATFAEQDGRTTITLRAVPHDATEAERKTFEAAHASMRQGWSGTLDQLADYLERSGSMKPQAVIPYLTVRGASEAIAFYTKVFGAVEQMRLPAQDGKRVMHAALSINGGSLFLSDEFPEQCSVSAPANGQQPPVGIVLDLASPADVDATYRRAIEAGATSTMEPSDQFWGARFAALVDPFGHRWMLNAALEKAA